MIGVDANPVKLLVKPEVTKRQMAKLRFVGIRPPPEASVDEVRKALSTSNLESASGE